MTGESAPEEKRPKKFAWRKLVRDKILDDLQDEDVETNFTLVAGDKQQHLGHLEDKAREEAEELRLDAENPEGSLEELADLQQIINDSLVLLGQTPEDLEAVRTEKESRKRGVLGRCIYSYYSG